MRLQIVFRKGKGARFLSHLDLLATLEYAMRRAGLPVELSEGFNPRPRMSIAAPLPLGHVGEAEILEIALREPVPVEEVADRFQAALPSGITIRSVHEMPAGQKLSASRLQSATYRVELSDPVHDLPNRVVGLLGRDTLEVEEQRQDRVRKRELRPLLLSLEAVAGNSVLRMVVHMDSEGTVRPEQILELLEIPLDGVRIIREKLEVKEHGSQ